MTFHATIVQKKLEDAGFDAKLAYGITAVLETDVVRDLEQRLVTRDYFDARMAEFDARFAKFEARIETRLAAFDTKFANAETRLVEVKMEMIKWMAGMIGGSTLAIILAIARIAK